MFNTPPRTTQERQVTFDGSHLSSRNHSAAGGGTLPEDLPIGLAVVDRSGRFIAANSALCRFLGYSSDELVTKTVEDVTLPEDFAVETAGVAGHHEARAAHYQIQKRYVRKDGAIVWGRLTLTVIPNAVGGVLYGLGVVEHLGAPCDTDEAPNAYVNRLTWDAGPQPAMPDVGCGGFRPQEGPWRGKAELTPRESQVLELLVAGNTLKQIATRGKVSVQSVWKHRQRILKKFMVENEVELINLLHG